MPAFFAFYCHMLFCVVYMLCTCVHTMNSHLSQIFHCKVSVNVVRIFLPAREQLSVKVHNTNNADNTNNDHAYRIYKLFHGSFDI